MWHLWHKWSKWEERNRYEILSRSRLPFGYYQIGDSEKYAIGLAIEQERVCLKCNKRQISLQKITII